MSIKTCKHGIRPKGACRKCRLERGRKTSQKYRDQHPDKIKERNSQWYAKAKTDPDKVEQIRKRNRLQMKKYRKDPRFRKIQKKRNKRWYAKNTENINARRREHYPAKKDKISKQVKKWKIKKRKADPKWYKNMLNKTKKWRRKMRQKPEYVEQEKQRQKRINKELRIKCFTHYSKGEPKCACCGEKHMEFLTINHIGGWRNYKDSSQRGGMKLYRHLIAKNYPKNFDVRCLNCNASVGWFGYCPHEKERLAHARSK